MPDSWTLDRGATILGGAVRFSVWAPMQERLAVRVHGGAGGAGGARDVPMERRDGGGFEVAVLGIGAGPLYQSRPGGGARPGRVSRPRPQGVHGAPCVVDPRVFRWADDGWRGRGMADLIIYELHVGSFSRDGTFDGV